MSNFFQLLVLSRENHLLSDLEIWHSCSLDLYLEKWYSDFSYLTCFMNYEVNHLKKCEFDKKLSQIKKIATPLLKIQVQGITVPNIKAR